MKRDRTVEWCQKKIVKVLTKKKQITTYLAMSACVLENVKSEGLLKATRIGKRIRYTKTTNSIPIHSPIRAMNQNPAQDVPTGCIFG